jgi:signal transduction histidine kinase
MNELIQFFLTHNVILTAAIAFGLGMWVFFEQRHDPRNVTLSGMLVGAALWSLAFLLWRISTDRQQAVFWLRMLFFAGSVLPILFFLFAFSFVRGKLPPLVVQAVLFLPSVPLFWIAFFTTLLVKTDGVASPYSFGVGRVAFAAHFAVFVIAALFFFFLSLRSQKEINRRKSALVLIGSVVSFAVVFAALFTVGLTDNAAAFWVANVALLVGMLIIGYGAMRERLILDLRVVSVEIFILVALFAVISDVALSKGVVDLTLRLIILIVLIFYGVLTSRAMVREVQHLRQMQAVMDHVTQMNGRLIEADRTKTRFVSFASHQLRAPLGGLRSYMVMLESGDFGTMNDKQREILRLNLGVLEQMLQTIESFLNLTKIELHKLELFRCEMNLRETIDRVIFGLAPLAAKKKLVIETDIPSSIKVIFCDSGKIYHVLTNLIDNAIKYTPSGKITVSVTQEKDIVAVRVIDTGVGLEQEEISRLFASFQRGLAGVTLNQDGSGLGLFIVKNIVEAHGGHVLVESPGKGKGSTFGFTLPIIERSLAAVPPLLTPNKPVV